MVHDEIGQVEILMFLEIENVVGGYEFGLSFRD
jgi:hypothetical protein